MNNGLKADNPGNGLARRTLRIILLAVIVAVLIYTCHWFAHSYGGLKRAIQDERIAFVEETLDQIITSHRFMRGEYLDNTARCAGIANRSGATTLTELARCYIEEDAKRILLISEAGDIVNLSGDRLFLADLNQNHKLLTDESGTELFASLNNDGDYWFFSTPIDPIRLDGTIFDMLVVTVPEEEYRGTLVSSLYDGRGAAYIIKKDGAIEVRSSVTGIPFSGYNLFESLERSGATQSDIAALQSNIMNHENGSCVVWIGGADWLVNFGAFSETDLVAVLVPLSVTAAETYAGLSDTIISAVCLILLIALIGLMIYIKSSYRDKERERLVLAAEAKSDFFSKMSHDIRTPLNAIVGLQTLAKDKCEDPVITGYLEQSTASTEYLLSIINDVLEMSRIESGKMTLDEKPFDMNAIISVTKTLILATAADKDIAFLTEVKAKFDREYLGDAVRIKQILVNILNNAVKFTPAGGTVRFTVTKEPLGDRSDNVVFVISDTGIGISEAFLPRIFTPFDQERSSMIHVTPGSGLGLAIVHSLVGLMGGTIAVRSKLGEGTAFTVTVPFEKGGLVAKAPVEKSEIIPCPGKRVLLAEDNNINRMIAVRLLQSKFALETETAGDGEQAVEMFSQSAPGYYDLILMDIKMPKMDGLAATRAIRALPRADAKAIPILALSANTFREDVEASLAAGMNGHLSKPMDIGALSDAFQAYIK